MKNLEYIQKTVLNRLSNVSINVYDFHIILYFYLGQIMQNKANFMRFSPENADFTKKQTQFKPNLSQFKANLTQFKAKTNPILTRQTGPIPKTLIRRLWSNNKSGQFENLSWQYLHLTYFVRTLLLGRNMSQLFLWGSLFFRKKRHLAHHFFWGG